MARPDVGGGRGLGGTASVDRGRQYCRAGRVVRLAVSEDGDVLAWVRGGGRYACRRT